MEPGDGRPCDARGADLYVLAAPGSQASSWATAYLYLDNNDRVVMPVVDGDTVKIMVVQTVESAGKPHFEVVGEYDITSYIGPGDNINGLMADWQGRIWFVVRTAATVGVLDPATGSIRTLKLEGSITNGFSMDRDAAYIDTTAKMYRVEAGPTARRARYGKKGMKTSVSRSRASSLPARARRRRFSATASMSPSPTTPSNCTSLCTGPTSD